MNALTVEKRQMYRISMSVYKMYDVFMWSFGGTVGSDESSSPTPSLL
jgi:hypothetical protein